MNQTPDTSSVIAPEGRPILATFFLVSAALSLAALWFLGPWGWIVVAVGLTLTLWCAWFFRDPARTTPTDATAVVSPADGVVCLIGQAAPPPDLGIVGPHADRMVRVCVFMNVFNVHVNRAPVPGVITKIAYHAGQFLNASFDKASELNERSSMALRIPDGRTVVAVQIAGLVARRIVSRVKEGQSLNRGERYGLIRFGSRVDVYLPEGSIVSAQLGQKVVAGETILATLAPLGVHASTAKPAADAVPVGA